MAFWRHISSVIHATVSILKELTDPEHIPLIYDAAHAHGAYYDGKPIGDFGTASVFSSESY